MQYNVEKCKVVHYGKHSIGFTYSMNGQLLEEATSEKDLGVVFSNDLKVRKQCEEAYSYKNPSALILHILSSLVGSCVMPNVLHT